eukprot:ANDGO_01092.mRNA.1 hypothetical protein PPTG_03187
MRHNSEAWSIPTESVRAFLSKTKTHSNKVVPCGGALVLLHGLWGFSLQFHFMGRYLNDQFSFKLFPREIQHTKMSTEENARALATFLSEHLSLVLEPGMPVHFAAHSFGGAVVRMLLSKGFYTPPRSKDSHKCPTRVVLLAPVVRGAQIARKMSAYGIPSWILGGTGGGGRELSTVPAQEFENMLGDWPNDVSVLTVLADAGRLSNPLIDSPNDGTLCWSDSISSHYLDRIPEIYKASLPSSGSSGSSPAVHSPGLGKRSVSGLWSESPPPVDVSMTFASEIAGQKGNLWMSIDPLRPNLKVSVVRATHTSMLWSKEVANLAGAFLSTPSDLDSNMKPIRVGKKGREED